MKVDTHLLAAAQAGNPAAMNALLTDLRPNIRRYARYQCARATAIDDVVQETLIIVNRRVGSLKNPAALGAWLARIVTRLCLLPALQLLRAAQSLTDIDNSIDFSTRSKESLRLDVARAIESLPADYREVILLRDFEELTIAEMAGRTNLSNAAVKSRLHRARALIREYLVTGGHTSSDEPV
jgi:RNA polymerase sigma-70 factor (ECF subfamily)